MAIHPMEEVLRFHPPVPPVAVLAVLPVPQVLLAEPARHAAINIFQ